MKAIVVLNGQFYSGENTEENKLTFSSKRSDAVIIDERRLRFIIKTITNWFMDEEIVLKRLEVLDIV
ncbi:hypothetical protein [Desulfosporosinus nitroreducens]|uniref:hypothetical protein n=1 Tax=Desulfosporosinus nitroreducens TaxID=2018668 RepID=UPI00207CC61C|nr:hypothetical protein [Desulfosporosinus nitroreducens]MCO1599770.1 hypothetical protein [Desulfosporosinus nitroreducens]